MTNFERIKNMSVEEMARILFTLPHEEIQLVKTSNKQGIDLLDVVNWLNTESEVVYDERKGERRDVDEHNKV